jgi:hypothetical protein
MPRHHRDHHVGVAVGTTKSNVNSSVFLSQLCHRETGTIVRPHLGNAFNPGVSVT